MKKVFVVGFCAVIVSCTNNTSPDNDEAALPGKTQNTIPAPVNIEYNIVGIYPHDTGSYTQGLEIFRGKFYEGSGDYEKSSVRIADIKSGNVLQKHMMGSQDIFGEGITIFKDKLYQLTWQSHIVYVYDVNNINKPVKTLAWQSEGWGLTHNQADLIVSDGITPNIYFVDPETFKIKSTIQVTDNNGPVDAINELEFINGYIYANVYTTDYIIKIDPSNGHIVGKMNFSGLINQYAQDYRPKQGEVLNGIAWDSAAGKMYITGKNWPKMFELTLK